MKQTFCNYFPFSLCEDVFFLHIINRGVSQYIVYAATSSGKALCVADFIIISTSLGHICASMFKQNKINY